MSRGRMTSADMAGAKVSSGGTGASERAARLRAEALEWADRARGERLRTRRGLSEGRMSLAQVLASAESDPLVGQVRVLWLLESLPGARKTDTRRALDRMGLAGSTALSRLGADRRAELLVEFGSDTGEAS